MRSDMLMFVGILIVKSNISRFTTNSNPVNNVIQWKKHELNKRFKLISILFLNLFPIQTSISKRMHKIVRLVLCLHPSSNQKVLQWKFVYSTFLAFRTVERSKELQSSNVLNRNIRFISLWRAWEKSETTKSSNFNFRVRRVIQ